MQTEIVTGEGPHLRCAPVDVKADGSWADIDAAFRGADGCGLRQAWRDAPQARFRPAFVRVGYTPDRLLVYATLEDADIFNPETRFNEPSFLRGDVFEMFLRPSGQDAYYEFHVTPENQRFQLRIPSEAAFRAPKPQPGIPAEWVQGHRQIESRVGVDAAAGAWRVLAGIPLDWVAENRPTRPGAEWRFSFSRYDYTRGEPHPVLSSSSAHAKVDYHRQSEWGRLTFA